MRFVFALLIIVYIGIIAYFDYLNPGEVLVNLTRDSSYSISKVGFFLFSFVFGSFIIIILMLFKDTQNIFQKWRKRHKHRIDSKVQDIYKKGMNSLFSGKFDEAISLFKEVIKIDRNHFNTLLRIGDAYQHEGNYPEAIKFHRRARILEDNNLEVYFSLVRDFTASGANDEAVSLLKETINKEPSNIEALTYLREIYVKTERWEEAHEIQGRIVKYRKDEKNELNKLTGLRYEFANLLYKKGEKEKSKKLLRTIIKADQNFAPAFVTLGEILIEENRAHEAAELWERSYNLNFNTILLHKLEDFYLQLGQPEKIIWIYKKAISQDADNTTLRFYLGKLYYRLEMLDEAFEIFSELENIDHSMPHLHSLLGNIYERKEKYDRAVEEFKKALGVRKMVIVPYYCPICDLHTNMWSGRCPRCSKWNTFTVSPVYSRHDVSKRASVSIPN